MEHVVYISAFMRSNESRTRRIAEPLIEKLSDRYAIEEIDLSKIAMKPVDPAEYKQRSLGNYAPESVRYAKMVASADRIIVAFPFWDMSFPSVFKAFCENISINGITFANNDDGSTRGNCKAAKILLITTRGMEIEDESILDQASSYLKALCWLWGIQNFNVVSANGLDVCDDKVRAQRIEEAISRGLKICEEF